MLKGTLGPLFPLQHHPNSGSVKKFCPPFENLLSQTFQPSGTKEHLFSSLKSPRWTLAPSRRTIFTCRIDCSAGGSASTHAMRREGHDQISASAPSLATVRMASSSYSGRGRIRLVDRSCPSVFLSVHPPARTLPRSFSGAFRDSPDRSRCRATRISIAFPESS